jgi:diguanylate cyclase (GGDEF)-like protein
MKIMKILVPVVFLVSSLWAVKYPIINYQTSDGLPENNVIALIQDHLGYIFIGTQSGIGKFDGNHFQVITKKDGLPNNYINDFEKDNQGNIWAATLEGLAKIDVHQNYTITSYMPSESIQSLKNDSLANTLWIFTKKGVYYLKEEQFFNYKILDLKSSESDEYKIKDLAISDSGVKYFYSDKEILKIKDDEIRQTIDSKQKINFLKWLPEDKKIAVGTETGLFLLTEENQLPSFTPYTNLPPGTRDVIDITRDEGGRIWVASQSGLFIFNKPSETPTIITSENGLTTVKINTILIDRERNIFIGTMWGLSQLSPNLFKMYDKSDGLPSEYVWDFLEDTENDAILVACDGGIAEINMKTGRITPLSSINRTLSVHSVRTIVKLGQRDFLLGTRNGGIYRWNRMDRLTRIHARARVFDGVNTAHNNAWFATDDGLLKYDGKTDRFTRFRDGLKDKNIWTLAVVDPENDTLLVGTGKGVQKFVKDKFVPSEIERRLNNNTVVNDIKVVSPAEIMVATELNGLYIFKDNRLKRITTRDGLLHNDVWSVIKDNSGSIWLNTTVSLDRYTHGFVSHYNKKTGLFGDEGSIHASFKSPNGTIYIVITPGIVEIPETTNIDIKKPILYIKEIKVKEKKLPLDIASHHPRPIQLKYGQNNIEFEYIAITTRKENPVFYKTRLHPLDTRWSEPTRETHIKYLNLPPDDYTFEVTANNGGGESEWFAAKNKISLVIIRPFWKTWWFILLMVLLGTFVMYFMVRLRLSRLKKQKKSLEEVIEQRTRQLQQLSITDPLTDLKNRRYLEEKIKEDINLIERYIYDKVKHPHKVPHPDGPMLGVFILDIDHFKQVNDEYGHKAGDIVIVEIARLLLEMLRNSDTIVRWGGEEFLIITRQYGKSSSFELAERIRKKIETYEFRIDEGITLRKTVSVGYAHFPFLSDDIKRVNWHHVVSLADSALYIAKNSGRNLSIGIECGERELDIDFKKIAAHIKMGVNKKYLQLVSVKKKKELTLLQHKT